MALRKVYRAVKWIEFKEIEVDFGPLPSKEKTFTIEDKDATAGKRVIAELGMRATSDKDLESVLMDALEIRGCSYSGYIELKIRTMEASLHGKFPINYIIS